MLLKIYMNIYVTNTCIDARSFTLERYELRFYRHFKRNTNILSFRLYNKVTQIGFNVYVVHVLWSDFVFN
jgi:hypothetical protein